MKKIIIAGISQFSELVNFFIKKEGYGETIAFTVNKEFLTTDTFVGLPVIPFEDLSSHFDMSECEVLLTFGYANLNAVREKVYNDCKLHNYHVCTFISKNAHVFSELIGEGTIVLPNVYIGPFSEIGKCNIIWNGVNISHHNKIGDFNNFAAGVTFAGNVVCGNNCFLGINSGYKNGVRIANRTFIAADSYVSKNTKENTAYTGSPARSIKEFTALEIINLVK